MISLLNPQTFIEFLDILKLSKPFPVIVSSCPPAKELIAEDIAISVKETTMVY